MMTPEGVGVPGAEGAVGGAAGSTQATGGAGAAGAAAKYTDEDVQRMVSGRVAADADHVAFAKKVLAMGGGLDAKAALAQLDQNEKQRGLYDRSTQTGIPLNLLEAMNKNEEAARRAETTATSAAFRTEALILSSGGDPLYASLKDPKILEEVTRVAQEKGLDLRSAFMVKHGEATMRQLHADLPRLVDAKIQEKMGQGSIEGSGGEAAGTTPVLTGAQKGAASLLGMTEDDYSKFSKIHNLSEYQKHQAAVEAASKK